MTAARKSVHPDLDVVRVLRRASRAGSLACIAAGAIVLVGWLFDVVPLTHVSPTLAPMKPSTALGFVLIGTALWLRHRSEQAMQVTATQTAQGEDAARSRTLSFRPFRVPAAMVVVLGLLTLLQHATGMELGMDGLFFEHVVRPSVVPGRMSSVTATNLGLLGLAILTLDVRVGRRKLVPAQGLALVTALLALLSLLGYAYGVDSLYAVGPFSTIALHTSFIHLVASAAIVCAVPDAGMMRFIVSDSPSGRIARRLMPAAVLLPALFGLLRVAGQNAGWYSLGFGTALFALANIVLFTALIWWSAGVLHLEEGARRAVESTLRESEALKSAILEAALDGIVLMNQEGRITEFNPAAEKTFGRRRADVVGRSLGDVLIAPSLRTKHEAGLQRYLSTGEARVLGKRIELVAMKSDGTEFPAEVAVVRIPTDGPAVFTGYIRDITERKRAAEAELLLKAKEAAEAANAELEAFSYSVAHDLRAPLRGINGFSAALLEDHGHDFDDDAKAQFRRITAASERMGQIIDGLLGLARLTRTELRRERVDLSTLARSVIEQVRATEPERNADFVVDDGLVTFGDPRLLRSLLENLLGNAWKFTREKPMARIEFRAAAPTTDGTAVYRVSDNGAGFSMAYSEKLFAPFGRLHSVERFAGTGIGLATVHRIVGRHSGRVWAEGVEERGATFFFTIGGGGPKAHVSET